MQSQVNLTATDSPLANTAWPALWLVMLLGAATFAWPATGEDAFQSGWTAYEHGDYREALDAWSPLAKQGHVGAQINLAVMYDHGIGVSQDIERALRWYQSAAGQDSAVAQYNLGLFLLDRQMLTAQDEGGLDWLRKAAGQNYADAQ